MTDDPSLPTAVSISFQQLKAAAAQLNAVSDELGRAISELDAALKTLNLGISAWVQVAGDFDHDNGAFWARELGYVKASGRWGIALRTREGDAGNPSEDRTETYFFSDAPRANRIEAVDKLPELLDKLIEAASETVGKVKEKIVYARQVVHAITAPTGKDLLAALTDQPPGTARGQASKGAEQLRALTGQPKSQVASDQSAELVAAQRALLKTLHPEPSTPRAAPSVPQRRK